MKPFKRNPFACHPIMKKGGLHQKSQRSLRQVQKQQLKKELEGLK